MRDTVLRQAGIEARYLPGCTTCLALDRRGRLLRRPAGDRGHLLIGEFVLFETLLLQLVGRSRRSAGSRISGSGRSPLRAEALPGSRASSRCPSRGAEARSARPARGAVRADALRVRRRDGGPRGIDSSRARRDRRRLRTDRLGQDLVLNLLPGFYDPTGGRVRIGGIDTRELALAGLSSSSRARHTASGAVLRTAARGLLDGPGGRGLGRGARRSRPRASTPSWTSFPTATTRSSASAGSTSRAASASAWRSRGRSSRETASWCSTTRSPPSTRSPSDGS